MENRGARTSPETLERRLRIVALVVTLALMAGAALLPHARYELTHDLPNPYWGIFSLSYSYTPEQGPPSASLLETRPDAIVAQFLADYIHVAGTFLCIASLADYQGYDGPDPVLNGRGEACTVHRPVAEVHITLVEMDGHLQSIPGTWFPEALVHYHVRYGDGEHLDGVMHLFPDRVHSQRYYATYLHDNCWDLSESGGYFYPHQMQQVPRGLRYFDGTQDRCSGHD